MSAGTTAASVPSSTSSSVSVSSERDVLIDVLLLLLADRLLSLGSLPELVDGEVELIAVMLVLLLLLLRYDDEVIKLDVLFERAVELKHDTCIFNHRIPSIPELPKTLPTETEDEVEEEHKKNTLPYQRHIHACHIRQIGVRKRHGCCGQHGRPLFRAQARRDNLLHRHSDGRVSPGRRLFRRRRRCGRRGGGAAAAYCSWRRWREQFLTPCRQRFTVRGGLNDRVPVENVLDILIDVQHIDAIAAHQ